MRRKHTDLYINFKKELYEATTIKELSSTMDLVYETVESFKNDEFELLGKLYWFKAADIELFTQN